MNFKGQVTAAGKADIAIEPGSLVERVRFWGLTVLWVVWNVLTTRSRPPGPGPRRPYRLTVSQTETGEVLYSAGTFRGEEARETAEAYASEIRRVGIDDWIFKKTHGWRVD